MSYIPQRTFNGMPGEPSTDTMGPEQLSHDLDELCKMFNKNAVHSDGSQGGIGADNINPDGFDVSVIGGISSPNIKRMKEEDGSVKYTKDDETWDELAKADSPALTGVPTAPTAAPGTNTQQIATTEFVQDAVEIAGGVVPASQTPQPDGVGAVGTSLKYAREDHVHPNTDKLFVVTEGVTPFDDIKAAIAAGKFPLCKMTEVSAYLPLVWEEYPTDATRYSFSGINEGFELRVDVTKSGQNTVYDYSETKLAKTSDLNRTNAVNVANSNYTTLMARGISLHDTETTPSVNGAIAFQYG